MKRQRLDGHLVEFPETATKKRIERNLGKITKRRGISSAGKKVYVFNYYMKLDDDSIKYYAQEQFYFAGRKDELLRKYESWVNTEVMPLYEEDNNPVAEKIRKINNKTSNHTLIRNYYKSDAFRSALAAKYENATYNATIQYLERLERSNKAFFDLDIRMVKQEQVATLFRKLTQVKDKTKPLAYRTKQSIRDALVRMYAIAKNDGITSNDPVSAYHIPTKNTDVYETKAKKNILNSAEKELVLDALKEFEQPFYAQVFKFILLTGLRTGEMQALEWPDVKWDDNIIQVHQTMTKPRGSSTHPVLKKYTKSGESEEQPREIPLYPQLRELLLEVQELQMQRYKKNNVARSRLKHDFIFTKENGQSYGLQRYSKVWRVNFRDVYFPKLGIKKQTTVHNLRGTYLTESLRQGVSAEMLARVAGHTDSKTTSKYYINPDRSDVQELASRLYT